MYNNKLNTKGISEQNRTRNSTLMLIQVASYIVSSHLASPPDPLAIVIQHERDGDEQNRQEAEQTARPADSELVVHRCSEQRKCRTEGRPHEVVSGVHRGHVFWIRVAQVGEDGHEEEECAHGEEGAADDGHDPVDRAPRGPAEPEQADRDEERAEKCRRQSQFGPDVTIFVELWLDVLVCIPKERGHDDESPDEDAEECEALDAEVEAVDSDEDDREGLEPAVQQGIYQRQIKVEGEADWLGEAEGEWSNKCHHEGFVGRHTLGVELWLTFQLVVAGELTQAAGAAVENVCGAGLCIPSRQRRPRSKGQ